MVIITKLALPSHQHYLNPFMIKLQRKALISPKSFIWTSKQPFAKYFLLTSCNVCLVAIPEIFAQTQRSESFRGKGHLATARGQQMGLKNPKQIIRRSKEQGQTFSLHQNLLPKISVVRPVSEISHTVTCLFAHFMKTLTSHCFGICNKFTSTVRCNSWCKGKCK